VADYDTHSQHPVEAVVSVVEKPMDGLSERADRIPAHCWILRDLPVHSTSQRQILALLDIDVWVLRGQSVVESGASSEPTVDQPVSRPTEPAPDAASAASERVSDFSLDLLGLHCAHALVIGELPLPEDRRFARDVLATLSEFSGQESTQTPFQWPQSSRGEQGRDAAGNALEAFLRGQVERAGVRVIVLFGDALRGLLLPDLDAGDQRVAFADAQCVLTGSTEQLRNSAERKRNLWQCILTIPARS
jgi:hypothetical protein